MIFLIRIAICTSLLHRFHALTVLFIERKKSAQIFGPRTWCTKKPFGYQIIHQDTVLSHVQDNSIIL